MSTSAWLFCASFGLSVFALFCASQAAVGLYGKPRWRAILKLIGLLGS